MIPYNKKLVGIAQEMRKNMTCEEKHLWYDFLKLLPFPVKRQHNLENYILDFYIPSKKIAIELDGRQHLTPEHQKADKKRDSELLNWGITVLRYSNQAVNENFNLITQDIMDKLEVSASSLKSKK